MGQTLPNGIYLPAEGERNCYDGLEGNWRSLDSLISTVAGKASATHTHGNITNDGKVGTTANLPLITGTSGTITTGSFGNTANTFCEGNDSRLSDARTPVAHTHTKSDVTDLLNSNFIPSANNSYDLGSSSYQWKSVYAQSYYYNGTAWGLDKANVWSGDNTFSAANLFRKRAFTLGDNSSQIVRMEYKDTNNSRWGILSFIQDTDNTVHCDISVHALKTDGQTVLNKSVTLLVKPDNSSEFKPINDKAIDLGTSTSKWKSFNGINPGALSLPDTYTNIDTTNWNLTGTLFSYTPPIDGWLFVNIRPDNNYAYVALEYPNMRNNSESTTGKNAMACIAVRANTPVSITLSGASIAQARLSPCAGNV